MLKKYSIVEINILKNYNFWQININADDASVVFIYYVICDFSLKKLYDVFMHELH